MGMFDNYPNFEEHFKVGDKFKLEDAKLGAMLNTQYGESQQVLFTINGTVYSALGQGFVGQATRAVRGDFPVEVEYCTVPPTKPDQSGTKILWPVGAERPWDDKETRF